MRFRVGKLTAPPLSARWILPAVLCLVLAAAYGPLLIEHARNASDDTIFNEDVRQQIPPFFRYAEPELAEKDALGDYLLANFPRGFRALYTVAGHFRAAVTLSETLPYLLLACTVVFLALTAYRLGGSVAAFGSVALCLAGSIYLAKTAGGLPRAFALPILSAWLAAATWGRLRIAAAIVGLGALFYPVAAFCSGVALTILVLLYPAAFRGEAAGGSLRRRLALLAVAAAVGALAIAPVEWSAGSYGPLLGPADVDRFPEAGPGGRYGPDIAPPYPSFLATTPGILKDVVFGAGSPWFETTATWARTTADGWVWLGAVLLVTGLGWIRLLRRDPAAVRFTALLAAAVVCYHAARLLAPHLYVPARYSFYPVTLLATIGIPAGFAGLVGDPERRWRGVRLRTAAVGLGCLVFLLPVAGRGDPLAGLGTMLVARQPDPIYAAVAALPPDSLIAGWPHGLLDNLPLIARRPVLLNYESHQAFHRDFVLETRKRMNAVITAYFATDVGPLLRLRERWGVTHFVVDPRVLRDETVTYFRPFDEVIAAARRQAGDGPFEVLRQAEEAAVFRSEKGALLDLSRLAPPSRPGAETGGEKVPHRDARAPGG
jgi:hypothetical protein